MSVQQQELASVLPDLREVPLDRLAELGGSALGQSLALYRERLEQNGGVFSNFTANI
jgi:FXSXX-COOH protein